MFPKEVFRATNPPIAGHCGSKTPETPNRTGTIRQILGITVSRQAIEQTPEAAETLKATLESAAQQAIASEPDALPLLNRFNGVYLQDSTWIHLPDVFHDTCKGTGDRTNTHKAALKLQLRLEVASGEFEHFQLTEGITADSTAEKQFQPLPEGSLRLT